MIKLTNNKPLKKFNWFKPAKAVKISFFKPNKLGKLKAPLFKPIKMNTLSNVRSIKKKDLTYPQAKLKNPKINPFGDADRDGKLNMFDCKPFDKKRHGEFADKRKIIETESKKELRERRGLTKVKEIDAYEFKENYEKKYGRKLDWNEERLKEVLKRDEDDAYPEVDIETGDIADGRHRIAAAALRRQKIDVAYSEEDNEND